MGIKVETHEPAEYHQYRDKRHHRIDAFDLPPVGGVSPVSQPRVVRGIIGCRSEICHHAVHDYRHEYAFDICKTDDADAPDDVSCAHERFALSDLVRHCSHDDRSQRRSDSACHDHRRDIRRRGMEHFVYEHIEVHVLHDPCDLSHESEHGHRYPEFSAKFSLHHRLLLS